MLQVICFQRSGMELPHPKLSRACNERLPFGHKPTAPIINFRYRFAIGARPCDAAIPNYIIRGKRKSSIVQKFSFVSQRQYRFNVWLTNQVRIGSSPNLAARMAADYIRER